MVDGFMAGVALADWKASRRYKTMRFALLILPQWGLSYADQLAVALRAEAVGFEALFRSDHYASFPTSSGAATTDTWAVLAGLARETQTITLGSLVSPVTFRLPGNLAKVITTVDEMAGGRIEVGLGAGWHEADHTQLGLPFPSLDSRVELLEETLAMLYGLWTEPDGWGFDGRQVKIVDASFHPKPIAVPGRPKTASGGSRPRIILGGEGSPRAMRIASRWADEFNITGATPEQLADRFRTLDITCREVGRDPATLVHSAMVGVVVGKTRNEFDVRLEEVLNKLGVDGRQAGQKWLREHGAAWVLGTPRQARASVERFAEVGVERLILQNFIPTDLEMIDLVAAEVIGCS